MVKKGGERKRSRVQWFYYLIMIIIGLIVIYSFLFEGEVLKFFWWQI